MNIHPNAKTTPMTRRLLVERVLQGWPRAAVAQGAGVSVRTVAKWMGRYRQGLDCLEDASSRPHRQPRATPPEVCAAVVALRHHRLTSWAIARQLGLPRSTVGVILRRAGLGRLTALEPAPIVQRYEWPQAGDLLHLDIKPLGRFRAVGHRFLGPARHAQTKGHGYEFVHVAIDDATRLAYAEVRRSVRAVDCARFLRHAVTWFGRRGIRIRRVLTDNGVGYVAHRFARVCRLCAVRHRRTRPYRPQTNGKAERFIQTLLREWAYVQPYPSSAYRARRLPRYLAFYNRRRPHTSLGGRTPWIRFQQAA